MDTHQIERVVEAALECVPKAKRNQFKGVFPVDHFVEQYRAEPLYNCNERSIYILNSHPSSGPGEHWFVIGFDMRGGDIKKWHGFLFDSLALDIREKYPLVYKYFESSEISYVLRNKHPVQDESVDSCALHVIYIVVLLIKEGYSFINALRTYDPARQLRNDCALLENFKSFLECQSLISLLHELGGSLKDTYSMCDLLKQ
jgi:hypothetical protein